MGKVRWLEVTYFRVGFPEDTCKHGKKQISVKIIFETKGDLNVSLLSSMNYLSKCLTLT